MPNPFLNEAQKLPPKLVDGEINGYLQRLFEEASNALARARALQNIHVMQSRKTYEQQFLLRLGKLLGVVEALYRTNRITDHQCVEWTGKALALLTPEVHVRA